MDYEKAYKEARQRMKDIVVVPETEQGLQLLKETVFPELAESEDERIRKEMLVYLKRKTQNTLIPFSIADANRWIAWLEKQKEPEDRGEISDGYHTFNELYYYRMLYNAAFFNLLPKEWVHKSKRHHDGEECFGGGWFIVMANLSTGQVSNHYELKDWDLFQIPEKEIADEWDGHTPQEAAERIHKYLLEKQKEQKSCPKGGIPPLDYYQGIMEGRSDVIDHPEQFGLQKPAEWSEEDKAFLKVAIAICNRYSHKDIADWLKSLPEKFILQPKQEWSEEDEKILNDIDCCISFFLKDGSVIAPACETKKEKALNWLKSLRPQPKQEWSEEDEKKIVELKTFIAQCNGFNKANRQKAFNMIDALRPQPHWKPSEEQMAALAAAKIGVDTDYELLESLYEQLKAL